MKSLKYLLFFFGIFLSQSAFSQDQDNIIEERNEEKLEEKEDEEKLFHFNLQLKNMHLWRGYHVSNSPVTAADVNYTSKNGFFKAGLWLLDNSDILLGEIANCEFYISKDQFEYWKHTQLTVDITQGRGSSFSLEIPLGIRFIIKSKLYTDDQKSNLKSI